MNRTAPRADNAAATGRRPQARYILLDRSLESLPVFRLSDSSEEGALVMTPQSGARWRVLPAPGDRLPGTFDQDVYVELFRRYAEAANPADGSIRFTLHAFLCSIGRRADGRTYEQLRNALTRLERTTLESAAAYWSANSGDAPDLRFSLLSGVSVERRRTTDRDQFALFPLIAASEPGYARVVLSPVMRANIAAGHVTMLSAARYFSLSSPVARRLYRLLEVARADGHSAWQVPLPHLAQRMPLSQRYPSHLQRVLQPANEMLLSAGVLERASFRRIRRQWIADFVLAPDS
jgi:plasmid replication initiation protein